MAEILVPTSVISEILGDKTDRYTRQLAAEGIIPKAGRGKYDLIAVSKAIIAWQASTLPATGVAGDLAEERAKLIRLQAERLKHENAIAFGDLIDPAPLYAEIDDMLGHIRREMMQVSVAVAPHLTEKMQPWQANSIVCARIRWALTECSKYSSRAVACEPPDESESVTADVTFSESVTLADLVAANGLNLRHAIAAVAARTGMLAVEIDGTFGLSTARDKTTSEAAEICEIARCLSEVLGRYSYGILHPNDPLRILG